ncbi:MAG: phosphoribosyltransferase [Acidobacteria bacterium]|nr:phosphoribosyltransferase [Acidobacteriota bacterium]
MLFEDRADAARQLAAALMPYRGRRPLVLGLPRGGVPMARIIADALDGDLDVLLVRKLCAPGQRELAIGAVGESGAVVRNEYFEDVAGDYVQEEIAEELALIRRRRVLYSGVHPPIDPAGRIVIVVDDGIATGASMVAAVRAVRERGPATVVVAVGVAAPSSLALVGAEADDIVCLHAPPGFVAVGTFYRDFSEVSDTMVTAALAAG